MSTQEGTNTGSTRDWWEPLCVACVGALQHADALANEIFERIDHQRYNVRAFNMDVALDNSTVERIDHVVLDPQKKIADSKQPDVIGLKEMVQQYIRSHVQRRIGRLEGSN